MEGLKLGEIEQAYYAELFQTCDVEGTGRITSLKASELFLASSLPQEALKQIWELCGAKRLGHFGRSQFYIALKLIAVAQNNLPLKLETLNTGIDIPLPKFSSKSSDQGDRRRGVPEGEGNVGDGSVLRRKGPASGALPPPPAAKQSHRRSLSGQYRGVVPDGSASFPSTPQQSVNRDDSPHNSKSPGFSPKQSPPTSPNHPPRVMRQHTAPAAYINASHGKDVIHDTGHINPVALASNNIGGGGGGGGPGGGGGGGGIINPAMANAASVGNGPTAAPGTAAHNSSNENGTWAMFEEDENHMLIGSGVKKWEASMEPVGGVDSSSISSEAESVDDVWTITEEQREYYIKQFLTMQPDLSKHITGPVAKNFFEKSKLPVVELSKIWQLSDLNRDGALSVEEFCIAMHLVVLRRNDIDLPDHLPISLMPYSTLSDEPFAADLPPGSTLKRATPPSPVENKWKASFVQESPGSSGVPSPAHLVNFDYAKPSADPDSKIIHPVAVRASPDCHPIPSSAEGFERGRAFSDSAVPPQHECGEEQVGGGPGARHPRAHTESHPPPSQPPPPPSDLSTCDSPGPGSKYSTNIQGRPRPIPKKGTPVPVVTRGQLQPPPPSSLTGEEGGASPGVGGSGDPAAASVPPTQGPPTPPPRPQMHGRSMSVDMKPGSSVLPPAVPPRVQPRDQTQLSLKSSESGSSAEPKGVSKRLLRANLYKHRRSASLGILKVSAVSSLEPSGEGSGGGSAAGPPAELPEVVLGGGEDTTDSKDSFSQQPMAQRQMSRDKRDIGMAIRTHKERNAMLTRLNSELNQELQEVMEQRIALEIQLEHLKPFSS